MTNVIRTEWLKMRKYPAFWAMLGIIALSYPGMNYMFYSSGYKDQLADKQMGPILSMLPNPFTFPDAWTTVAYISSLFIFLPALMVIMFISNEYSFKTHRQNIIDGWSRTDFLVGKLIDVLLVSVLVTVLYAVTAFIIGSINSGAGVHPWEGSRFIGLFFLQVLAQLSLALLLALVVRKAFIALGLFMFYYFPLEPFIVAISKKRGYKWGEYMPLEISDRLIPFPRWFTRDETEWKTAVAQSNAHIGYTLLLIAVCWLLCFWINKKRDL
ncbi:ABC transporter permease subunit [Flaviaesturariibacter terrae]